MLYSGPMSDVPATGVLQSLERRGSLPLRVCVLSTRRTLAGAIARYLAWQAVLAVRRRLV